MFARGAEPGGDIIDITEQFPAPADDSQKWDEAKHFAHLATRFTQAAVACQVMTGLILLELHESHGIRRGFNNLPNCPRGGQLEPRAKWADLVKERVGIGKSAAHDWMKMAEGVREKFLGKLPALQEVMELPPTQWTAEQSEQVFEVVKERANGATQADFMAQLGLTKQHRPNRGGDRSKYGREDASVSKVKRLEARKAESTRTVKNLCGEIRVILHFKKNRHVLTDVSPEDLYELEELRKDLGRAIAKVMKSGTED